MTDAGKARARREFLERRRALSADAVRASSAAIVAALRQMPEVAGATVIAGYAAFDKEPDILPVLVEAAARGATVLLPRHATVAAGYEMARVFDMDNDLVEGKYGIREPRPEAPTADAATCGRAVWLTPGVAFARDGARLGMGKGVYDRLLKGVAGIKIGVAYEWQVAARLPVAPGDVAMDQIVTERGPLQLRSSGNE